MAGKFLWGLPYRENKLTLWLWIDRDKGGDYGRGVKYVVTKSEV